MATNIQSNNQVSQQVTQQAAKDNRKQAQTQTKADASLALTGSSSEGAVASTLTKGAVTASEVQAIRAAATQESIIASEATVPAPVKRSLKQVQIAAVTVQRKSAEQTLNTGIAAIPLSEANAKMQNLPVSQQINALAANEGDNKTEKTPN
jgi:hypothetical protein